MRDKKQYNNYMVKYMKKRYKTKRSLTLISLGNQCAKCNTKKNLEIDHIDSYKKDFDISKIWNYSENKFKKELNKCQLLCQECHIKKTRQESNQLDARSTHGTLSSYRYCKCIECKKVKRDWMREYRKKKKLGI